MYIAIILENFNQAHQEEEVGIVEDDLEMFYIRWSKYDPHASQFISFAQLTDFIASLDPPLGIPKPNTVALVSFNLPISEGNKIHCLDILHALVKHVLGHVDESDTFKQLQDQMDVKFRKQFPTRKEIEIVSSTRIWRREERAAKTIQTAWREYLRHVCPPHHPPRPPRVFLFAIPPSETRSFPSSLFTLCRLKRERERSPLSLEDESRSSPGWQNKLSALNFLHLQVSANCGAGLPIRLSDSLNILIVDSSPMLAYVESLLVEEKFTRFRGLRHERARRAVAESANHDGAGHGRDGERPEVDRARTQVSAMQWDG